MPVGLSIAVVLALIVLNGLFAMAEMAVVASSSLRLKARAEGGDAGAARALALSESPDRFLSTVQVGITLIGIIAGAFGGATLSGPFADALRSTPVEPYAGVIAVTLVVATITYLSLVAGELVPKQLALRNPETIAATVAGPMGLLSRGVSPAVSLLSSSTSAVLRLLGIGEAAPEKVTEEEIRMLIQQGRRTGVLEPEEEAMVEGVFDLGDRIIADIMTPRPRVTWLDLDDADSENLARAASSGYTRFPVARGSLDNVVGVLAIRDLWEATLRGETPSIEAMTRPALFVPGIKPVLSALPELQRGPGLAIVVDEFGGTDGIITVADVVDEVVEDVAIDPRIRVRPDGSAVVDGLIDLEDFVERFRLEPPPEEFDVQTAGGYVMALLDRVPQAGDAVDIDGLRVQVREMDGNRVATLLVTRHRES